MKIWNWLRSIFIKKEITLFIIDEVSFDHPQIRVGFLVKILTKDRSTILVRIPSMSDRTYTCIWGGSNYYLTR